VRLIAIWISMPASGARIITRSRRSGWGAPRLAAAEEHAEVGQQEMAPAMVAEMVEIRMSRFFTCASSCAITPRSSRSESMQDAGGRRHRGIVRVAPGGEGVGLRLVDEIDLGHRQLGALGELALTML
jgi:hypothetical protein